jgi:hypothetical protein
MKSTLTREEWLLQAIEILKTAFEGVDATIPEAVRVTCGWPSRGGRAEKKQVLGECWPPSCSEDGHTEVFIAPTISDPVEALGVLVHELVHAAVGCDLGHKGAFRTVATALGLEGKMTATTLNAELTKNLESLADQIGKYPHAKLTPQSKPSQSTRMLKFVCPKCGWAARTSQKWIDLGLPTCACETLMEVVEPKEQDEEEE